MLRIWTCPFELVPFKGGMFVNFLGRKKPTTKVAGGRNIFVASSEEVALVVRSCLIVFCQRPAAALWVPWLIFPLRCGSFFGGDEVNLECCRCCVGWRILWGLEIEKNMDDSGVSKSNPLNRVNDIIVINIVKGFIFSGVFMFIICFSFPDTYMLGLRRTWWLVGFKQFLHLTRYFAGRLSTVGFSTST